MANLTWPSSLVPNASSVSLEENTAAFENPLTGTVQTLERPGARWRQSLSFTALQDDERAALQAFLVSLRGQANRAVLPVFGHSLRGAGGGTPQVAGASQGGATLTTDGWPNSTLVLKAGDFFTVNNELKMVTEDITSDGSGNATLAFAPILRTPPADNASIYVTAPTAKYILVTSAGWTNEPGVFSGFTVEFIEAFT